MSRDPETPVSDVSRRTRARRRQAATRLQEGGLVLAGILVPVLAIEIGLRVTGFGTVRPQMDFDAHTRAVVGAGHLVPDQTLLWREADPGPDDAERSLHVIRAGDQPPPKSGKRRLLCLGDSCTRLSVGGRPYSVLLEAQLGADRVEVMNAALPGYSSYQGLAWLRTELLDYEPDLLVVYLGWNDHWRATGWTDRELGARYAWWRPRILNLVERRPDPPPFRVPLDAFARNLAAIAAAMAARGGETLFVVPPARYSEAATRRHVETGYLLPGDDLAAIHARYQEVVRRLASGPERRTRVFDAAALFDALEAPELLFPDGIHLTDLGHYVLAVTLADEIAARDLGEGGSGGGASEARMAPAARTAPVALAEAVLAQSLAAASRWAEALERSARAAAAAPGDLDIFLGHAWLLAASPIDSLRDAARALAELDAYRGPAPTGYRFQDVKAAALAARGRYAEAVAASGEALRSLQASGAPDSALAAGIRARRERYAAGEPYRLPDRAP